MEQNTAEKVAEVQEYCTDTPKLSKQKKALILVSSFTLTIMLYEFYERHRLKTLNTRTLNIQMQQEQQNVFSLPVHPVSSNTDLLKCNIAAFDTKHMAYEKKCSIVVEIEDDDKWDPNIISKVNAYTFIVQNTHNQAIEIINDLRQEKKEMLIREIAEKKLPLRHIGCLPYNITSTSCDILGHMYNLQYHLDDVSLKSIQIIMQNDSIKTISIHILYKNLDFLEKLDFSNFDLVPLSYIVLKEHE